MEKSTDEPASGAYGIPLASSNESELSPKELSPFQNCRSVKYYARRYGTGMVKELEEKGDKTATKVKGEEVEKIWMNAEEALKEATGKVKPEQLLKPGRRKPSEDGWYKAPAGYIYYRIADQRSGKRRLIFFSYFQLFCWELSFGLKLPFFCDISLLNGSRTLRLH